MPDFSGRSGVLRVKLDANLKGMPTALNVEVGKIRENLNAVHAEFLLRVKNAAEENFRRDIKRPAERGEGEGGRRQTGNFTFGTTAGGAFVGQLFQDGNVYGFGYPDIQRADQATERVWRALEYGLSGTKRFPRTLGTPFMTNPAFPERQHKMPLRYHFTSPSPKSSVLVLGGGANYTYFWRRNNYMGFAGRKTGAGIEGKHFLELAFDEVAGNRQLVRKGYQAAVQKAIKTFS